MAVIDFLGYGTEHRELIEISEQINILLNQLRDGKYDSLDTYMNNCDCIRELINTAIFLLQDKSFEKYLIRNNPTLFYNLQTVVVAIEMMKNFLENLAGMIKKPVSTPA